MDLDLDFDGDGDGDLDVAAHLVNQREELDGTLLHVKALKAQHDWLSSFSRRSGSY